MWRNMEKKIKIRLDDGQIVEGVMVEEEVKVVKITIKNRYNESIIYESEKETIKEAVEEAVEKGVDLESANLESANLKYSNLESANLESAKTKMCVVNFSELEYKVAKVFIEGLKNKNEKS